MTPQEQWHWVHISYGEELGLTSSDDDYVPPPAPDYVRDRHTGKDDGSLAGKVRKNSKSPDGPSFL